MTYSDIVAGLLAMVAYIVLMPVRDISRYRGTRRDTPWIRYSSLLARRREELGLMSRTIERNVRALDAFEREHLVPDTTGTGAAPGGLRFRDPARAAKVLNEVQRADEGLERDLAESLEGHEARVAALESRDRELRRTDRILGYASSALMFWATCVMVYVLLGPFF